MGSLGMDFFVAQIDEPEYKGLNKLLVAMLSLVTVMAACAGIRSLCNRVFFVGTAAEIRHLFAKFPVSSPQTANKFNDLGEFLIQK